VRETVQLVVVGTNHNSASVSLRERLTVSTESLPGVLRALRESVAEALVLSTCNRVELYAVCGHESSGADVLRQFLAAHGDVPLRVVRDATYAHGHEAAVRHLLRVTSGLESVVLGENEILGQVRRAIMAARDADTLGPVLDRLGDSALACGKRTRASTSLGRDGESVASVAVRLASRERGGLDGAHVVVLGAGDTARSALTALARNASVRITLVNRTYDRAAELAAEVGVEARPWSELVATLAAANVVVGCTGSAAPVLDAAMMLRAREVSAHPLLCIDLGVPRDIDPAVAALAGVRLIDLERIELEAETRRAERARDLVRAESIVEQETERYMEWWRGRGVASTIARLHARADAIRDAEVDRALARLPEMSPHDRAVVRDLAARVVAKLLRDPTLALKRDPEGANMALVVERLFALSDAGDFASEQYALGERPVHQDIRQPDIHQESRVS
jgi:glutamyl-tRNA reductase